MSVRRNVTALCILSVLHTVLKDARGRAVAEAAAELLDGDVYAKSVVIFAGKGNNGGDGLVAARWLSAEGARVKIFLASPVADFTGAAAMQLKICAKSGLACGGNCRCPCGFTD